MTEKLAGYEVVIGLLGAYMEATGTKTIPFPDRSTLYTCIYKLCLENTEKVSRFTFRKRHGRYTSDDVDLCLRNLEDSKSLACLNPGLVDFQSNPLLETAYNDSVKGKIENFGLMDAFIELAKTLPEPQVY